jgi:hypothetical protein
MAGGVSKSINLWIGPGTAGPIRFGGGAVYRLLNLILLTGERNFGGFYSRSALAAVREPQRPLNPLLQDRTGLTPLVLTGGDFFRPRVRWKKGATG